jgi:hypothetical protein
MAPDTTITSGPPATTGDDTPTFSFTSTESGSPFECRVDSGGWETCTSPWTTGALADGPHSVSVRATDQAGNTDGSPATHSFTVDTSTANTTAEAVWTAPTDAVVGQPVTLDGGASRGDAPLTCTWSFENQDGSIVWETVTGCVVQKTFLLADTKHVELTVSDGNGDTGTNRQSFQVGAPWVPDTTPPNTTVFGPAGTSSDSTRTFSFTSTESGSTFQCRVDSGGWTSCTSPAIVTALSEGAHTFRVRAIDAAGNVDPTPATRSFTVDPAPAVDPRGEGDVPEAGGAAVLAPDDIWASTVGPLVPDLSRLRAPGPLAVPRTIRVHSGAFELGCGAGCLVRALKRVRGHRVVLAAGNGDRVRLTRAGRKALRKAGRRGLRATVEVRSGSEFRRTRALLKRV